MSMIDSPKLYIILALVALGTSGFSVINSTDSVHLRDLEEKFQIEEMETQSRLEAMDTKIQIEMRLLADPLERQLDASEKDLIDTRKRLNILEREVATLLERTRP